MSLADVEAFELMSVPGGWPEPLLRTMARAQDFAEAFTTDSCLWVRLTGGARFVIPLAQVKVIVPSEWP